MTWPWTWLLDRRKLIARAEVAMRHQLTETRTNNARNREVLASVREAAALSHGGGASG